MCWTLKKKVSDFKLFDFNNNQFVVVNIILIIPKARTTDLVVIGTRVVSGHTQFEGAVYEEVVAARQLEYRN